MSLFQQLADFFAGTQKPARSEEDEHPLLPRVALLLEAATYDDDFAREEKNHISMLLQETYGIQEDEVDPLLEMAAIKSHDATDLHELTRDLSNSLSPDERTELMIELWTVVLADGSLHKNEDLFVRKMQKLLRLDRSVWIQAKLTAKQRLGVS